MHHKMKRTWQRLTADKQRFSLFCVLLFVGLLLWARIIVIARPAKTAIAEPIIETEVAAALISDKIFIPVSLEAEPTKNPFSISTMTFPGIQQSTDNNNVPIHSTNTAEEKNVVSAFNLEAIMGELAMINGQVLQVGDVVGLPKSNDPLRLEEVRRRSVIISAGNRRYELSIAPPRR